MTLSALRLQRCRGAKALFEKSTSALRTNFYCRFSRMLFLPLLFQRRLLARFRKESLGGVSHSDGHSVVNRQNKKPIHSTPKQREGFSRSFWWNYVSALNFKSVLSALYQPRKQTMRIWLVRQCLACRCLFLKSSFILYSVVVPRLQGIVLYQKSRWKSTFFQRDFA